MESNVDCKTVKLLFNLDERQGTGVVDPKRWVA